MTGFQNHSVDAGARGVGDFNQLRDGGSGDASFVDWSPLAGLAPFQPKRITT